MNQPPTNIFNSVNEQIISDVKLVLFAQGHNYTGSLFQSMKLNVSLDAGEYVIGAIANSYIDDLEYGISPEEISRRDIDMEKLSAWVKFRRSQGHPTPSASKLVYHWKQKGYELSGAALYVHPDLNGRYYGAVTLVFQDGFKGYGEAINERVVFELDKIFHTQHSEVIK